MNTDEVINIIKQTEISTIVSRYVSLRKNGANHWGICPFHGDTKPSMSVNDSKGIFKCFSCGAAGDAILFVEDFRNLDFKEAVVEIAEQLGLPTQDLFQRKERDPKFTMASRVLSSSAKLYRKIADSKTLPEFETFIRERNLKPETVEKFAIGLAPKNSALFSYLLTIPNEKERQNAIDIAQQIGIIRANRKQDHPQAQTHYDTFRERIMFPMWDQFDQIVGYSSRAIYDYQKAKYMNSQDSFQFNKGNLLYGFNFAKSHIRKEQQVILVEGHMDMITMDQNGFHNTVAIMGVALGAKPIETLKSITSNFILALDADKAGFDAMKNANRDLMKVGIIAKYIDFAPFKDADEYLQENPPQALKDKIDHAGAFLDREIQELIPEELSNIDAQRKLEILEQIFAILSPLQERLIATEKVVESAKLLELNSTNQQIIDNYQQFLKKPHGIKLQPLEKKQETPQLEQRPITRAKEPELGKTGRLVIRKLVMHPECCGHKKLTELIDFANDTRLEKVISDLKSLHFEIEDDDYLSAIRNYLVKDDLEIELKKIIFNALFNYHPKKMDDKDITKLLKDLQVDLQIENHRLEALSIQERIDSSSSDEEKFKLMDEIYKIRTREKDLKRSKGKI